MKKTYETPSIEVVKFQYRDQVVVASNGGSFFGRYGQNSCENEVPASTSGETCES